MTTNDTLSPQVRRDIDFWRDVVDVDQGIFDRFVDLAERSRPYLTDAIPIRIDPSSAFSPASGISYWTSKMPETLATEWAMFARRWDAFAKANPLVRIAGFLSDVSESHDSSSFPYGREAVIREWVVAGFPDPIPFDDRSDIVTPDWKSSFRSALDEAGNQWVVYEEGRLVRTGHELDPARVAEARRLAREYHLGLGIHQIREGISVADARFEGEIVLGMLWVDAAAYAVSVGNHLPTKTARRAARDDWNDATARSHLARLREMFPGVEEPGLETMETPIP